MAAESDGQLNNKIWAESAGLADITFVTATSDTNFTNKVVTSGTLSNIGKMENGDITLSAHDDNVIKTEAEVVIPASVAAGVGAVVNNKLTRTNSVDMGGTVDSARDLNLYAGRDASGEKSTLDMDLATDIYNHAAIPIDKPKVINTVTENYQVNVKGQGSAAQHVNVTASPGKTDIMMAKDVWVWTKGQDDEHSFVGNDRGVPDYGQTANNFVNLDGGKLIAGRLNSIDIAIKGTALPDGYKLSNGSGSNLAYTVKVGDGSDKSQEDRIRNGIKVSEVLHWPDSDEKPNVIDYMRSGKIDLAINIPKNNTARELENGYKIRRTAVDFNIPLITNARQASAFIYAFCKIGVDGLAIKRIDEYV